MEVKALEYVNVGVRIRPSMFLDSNDNYLKVITRTPPVLYISERNQTYSFDYIFPEHTQQNEVYETLVQPLVNKTKSGYNCTVFAYGQTGAGKTYTMGTSHDIVDLKNAGLISRTLDDFFIAHNCNNQVVSVSFFEIYNEKVYDLLNNKSIISVKDFKNGGLHEEIIYNKEQAYELLHKGSKDRHVAETKQNNKSSRSHAVFILHYWIKNENHEIKGKLNLVDLAGSESVKKNESRGSQFHEGISINKGLFHLGQVISALSSNTNHVPYRQSVITSILQDSLSKNNYVTLIACISPDICNIPETISVLDFAQRVKRIKNKPEVNNVILKYKKRHPPVINIGSAFKLFKTPMKQSTSNLLYHGPVFQTHEKTSKIAAKSIYNSSPNSPDSNFFISTSSVTDIPQSTISPIIKKCLDAFQITMRDKLQTVLNNTTQGPYEMESINWKTLENTVSRMVKNELSQNINSKNTVVNNTFKTNDDMEASSSTIEKSLEQTLNISNESSRKVSKNLFGIADSVQEQFEDEHIFKIPFVPSPVISKRHSVTSTEDKTNDKILSDSIINGETLSNSIIIGKTEVFKIPTLSPVVSKTRYTTSNWGKTRSKRLSENIINGETEEIFRIPETSFSINTQNQHTTSSPKCKRRKSVRLSQEIENYRSKSILKVPNLSSSLVPKHVLEDNNQNICKTRSSSRFSQKISTSVASPKQIRRSIRLSHKFIVNSSPPRLQKKNIKKTPVKRQHKIRKVHKNEHLAREQRILYLLNNGSHKELQSLAIIGIKTANQIIAYREIYGQFNCIADLKHMPWHRNLLERFLSANFLSTAVD